MHLCDELQPKQKCFRVLQYKAGKCNEVFHEHIPLHRISIDAEIEALRGLADHYAGWPGTFILHSRLNNRPGAPSAYPGYRKDVSYPEPGVIRRHFGTGDASAWSDTVLSPAEFRKARTGKRGSGSKR